LRSSDVDAPEPAWSALRPQPLAMPDVIKPNPADGPLMLDPRPAGAVHGKEVSHFDGRWLFAADAAQAEGDGKYPARYVEFVLHEEHDRLAGEFRALYSRLDRAISPEVVFHVQGEVPSGSAGALEWESNAGARGELELTLQAPNRLLVKWWTTRFGRREALSSGMAGLTRLKVP